MTLADLGFDAWHQEKLNVLSRQDFAVARITRVDRDRYLVRNENAEIQAEPTGKLLFTADSAESLPCVGDWVFVEYHNDGTLAIVHDVFPRKTFLRRKAAGKTIDYQMIASNIDVACIVQSCDVDFNVRRLERYLVMTHEGGIEPVVLLSKSDLVNQTILDDQHSEIEHVHPGTSVITCSSVTPHGLDSLKRTLAKGKTYCLLGSSGVGKTTLLNQLLGREEFETNTVRESDGKGRHTTAHRQLTVLETGALLIDTPGMRELGMVAVAASIDDTFSEIRSFTEDCRFNDCTHTTEVGCGVLMALQRGDLTEERYQSYLKLKKESDFHRMSYVQRRKKDKQFGRMINKAMKLLKKK